MIREKEMKNFKPLTVNKRIYSICKRVLTYYLSCRKNTESKKLRVSKTKRGKPMLLSKCEV